MNLDSYQQLAIRTAPEGESKIARLTHAALGIATEAGEYTTEVKRAAIYGRALTEVADTHMAEELGDILWYIALAAEGLGMSLNRIAEANIEKLRVRFPGKFSGEAAEARADKGGLDARES